MDRVDSVTSRSILCQQLQIALFYLPTPILFIVESKVQGLDDTSFVRPSRETTNYRRRRATTN
jgi:hypothetical protein